MIIDSFWAKLGFDIDDKALATFGQQAEALGATVLKLGAVVTGASLALGAMVLKVADGMDATGDFADIVGMTAREVDALGKVASMNDSSMEAMKSTLQGLSGVIGQASLGVGRGAKIFEKLGFEAKDAEGNVKDVTTVLGEVADKFQDMSAQEKLGMAGRLGIDASLIPLLSKGKEGFMELRNAALAANPLTEEQYRQADRIIKAWAKAKASAGMYTKLLGAKLFPIMESVLDKYNEWMKAGKSSTNDALAAGLKVVAAALRGVWDWVVRVVTAVKASITWLAQFKIVTWAVGAALAALIAYKVGGFLTSLGALLLTATRSMMAFNLAAMLPAIGIGLLAIAIGLVVDDLVNFFEGNDSVIGQFMDDYPSAFKAVIVGLGMLGAAFVALKWQAVSAFTTMIVQSTMAAVRTVAAAVVMAGGVMPLIGIYAGMAASAIAAGVAAAAAWFIAIAPIALVIAAIVGVGVAIWALWNNWDTVKQWMGAGWDWLKDKIFGFIEKIKEAYGWVKKVMGFGDASVSVTNAIKQAPALQNEPSYDPMTGAQFGGGYLLGSAERSANSTKNSSASTTVTVGAPTININSPDPTKAGEAVRDELTRMNKAAIRNGQTGTSL